MQSLPPIVCFKIYLAECETFLFPMNTLRLLLLSSQSQSSSSLSVQTNSDSKNLWYPKPTLLALLVHRNYRWFKSNFEIRKENVDKAISPMRHIICCYRITNDFFFRMSFGTKQNRRIIIRFQIQLEGHFYQTKQSPKAYHSTSKRTYSTRPGK